MSSLYCPSCARPAFKPIGRKKLLCAECDFVFYRNAASSVAVIIRYKDQILLATRGREPAKGLFDLPGGFVDPGESLEQAVYREIREELALELPEVRYLCSEPNEYLFANVTYDTTDAFFEVRFDEKPEVCALDDVAAVSWHAVQGLNISELAFASQQRVLHAYCSGQIA